MKRKIFPSAVLSAALAGGLLPVLAAPLPAGARASRAVANPAAVWEDGSWQELWHELLLLVTGSALPPASSGVAIAKDTTAAQPAPSTSDDTHSTLNPDGTPITP